ncbi:MAG: CDP-diacylglycerol--glycerol-3-phosphate 3-phosphatidyltransferase [Rhodospirillaceae bacterium]|nr:CDP-diacylglycerol--glycerol-3-phosphate 3-phosphatidyltransferase [Rhodospirillaceae bacterium]|tara:strand:+ start:165 stop:740 length:576 start_codon:yes stop_codon:yes gene_type:complete
MLMTIPNILTGFRIGAIPLVVVIYYLPFSWAGQVSGIIFGMAAVTDWLDGYLARRLNQSTKFGEFLDPVADKLIVTTALVVLVQNHPSIVMMIVAIIIIGREIAVSALREWMSKVGAGIQVKVTYFAKWKTTLQMFGIGFRLYEEPSFGIPIYELGMVLLIFASLLTILSMIDYLRSAWPVLIKQNNHIKQ